MGSRDGNGGGSGNPAARQGVRVVVEFGLLGPLSVRDACGRIEVTAPKLRVLLAALLVNANRVVSIDGLVDTIWPAEPPPAATVTVRGHVKRLRSLLGAEAGGRLLTRSGGYLLRVEPAELDTDRFVALFDQGRAAADAEDWAGAGELFGAALRLWRGEPLADVPPERVDWDELPRLRELHTQALEWRVDAELALGRHVEVVAALRRLCAATPLRERRHGQLMLALFRSGRQAEALAQFQAVRSILADELGVEPGAELRTLHERILRDDRTLSRPVAADPVPAQLPAAMPGLVGRQAQLDRMDALLAERDTAVVATVDGTAGVGKSVLAVHWAHRVRGRFPDGQLHADLCGFGPLPPADPTVVLGGFLRALGEPGDRMPADLAGRAALYRSRLAGRRVLVVLDNAAGADQVRPLLPGGAGCLTVVTSRSSLRGLAVRDGAHPITVGRLDTDAAAALLTAVLGPDRVSAQPAAVADLAALCAGLPLALGIVADRAARDTGRSLAELVVSLREGPRLDLLGSDDDLSTDLRAVFSWSYQGLPPGQAELFTLLGRYPGRDIGRDAAAALLGRSVRRTRPLLDGLAQVHLVEQPRPDRYQPHDLLRVFAAGLPWHADDPDARAALGRLFDHHLDLVTDALRVIAPGDRSAGPTEPDDAKQSGFADADQARAWLDTELPNLLALAAFGAANGWPDQVGRLAAGLWRHLHTDGRHDDALALHRHAVRAATECGDDAALGVALHNLGTIHHQLGHYEQAAAHIERALDLARATGDRAREARALNHLGLTVGWVGDHDRALRCHEDALAIARDTGDRNGEASALNNLGLVHGRLGEHERAAVLHADAAELAHEVGYRIGEATALANLGLAHRMLGRYAEAAERLRAALEIAGTVGHRISAGFALANLGLAVLHTEDADRAREHLLAALRIGTATGTRGLRVAALNGLGSVEHADGRFAEAAAAHQEALEVSEEDRDTYEQARSHAGLGAAHVGLGDTACAREHWRVALRLYTEIRAPEAAEVGADLARLGVDP